MGKLVVVGGVVAGLGYSLLLRLLQAHSQPAREDGPLGELSAW